MSTSQSSTKHRHRIELCFWIKKLEIKNEVPEYEIKMKLKLKQNIGMSFDIDIEVTENEIKNEKCSYGKWNQNEIKILARVSTLKNRNRKCSNENEIKKIKAKSKYQHECQHCSRQHSEKLNKIKL